LDSSTDRDQYQLTDPRVFCLRCIHGNVPRPKIVDTIGHFARPPSTLDVIGRHSTVPGKGVGLALFDRFGRVDVEFYRIRGNPLALDQGIISLQLRPQHGAHRYCDAERPDVRPRLGRCKSRSTTRSETKQTMLTLLRLKNTVVMPLMLNEREHQGAGCTRKSPIGDYRIPSIELSACGIARE
jgi:hypothetical protein